MFWVSLPDSILWLGRRALLFKDIRIPWCTGGNLRAQVFFSDDDRRFTLEMRLQCATRFGAEIWAYCLMGNSVHLIAVPQHKDAPGRPFPGQGTGNWQGLLNQELTGDRLDPAEPRHRTTCRITGVCKTA